MPWYGFSTADDMGIGQRLEAVIRHGIRSGLCPTNQLTVRELADDADESLFTNILRQKPYTAPVSTSATWLSVWSARLDSWQRTDSERNWTRKTSSMRDVCVIWRKKLRRTWDLRHNTQCNLLPLLCDVLPLMDELSLLSVRSIYCERTS